MLDDGSVQAGPYDQDWFFKKYDSDLYFIAEYRITPESFDLRQAVNAGGYFLGDYVNCSSTDNDFVCTFTRTYNQGLPVRGTPPDDVLAFDEYNRQDMAFVRIQGESVCDFKHTLKSYHSQSQAAEINIPLKRKLERLNYLRARYDAACHSH